MEEDNEMKQLAVDKAQKVVENKNNGTLVNVQVQKLLYITKQGSIKVHDNEIVNDN